MPSFDILNKPDFQMIDNGINTAKKELFTRYDLKDSDSVIEYDKKNSTIKIISDSEMHVDAVVDIVIARVMKQGISPNSFDTSDKTLPSGKTFIKTLKVKNGIDKETAKKISKYIKETGIKVSPSIMDEIIRVSGKQLDDLQKTISLCRTQDFGVPLQYDNMKR